MSEFFKIREFRESDFQDLLEVFRLNAPKFFSPQEEEDLTQYLHHKRELYFVIEVDQKVIGGGGINFDQTKTHAFISWDLIHPSAQHKSYGTALMQHRLNLVQSLKSVQMISVRTSQMAYQFYQRFGFSLVEVIKDYWAAGFDLYHMDMPMLETVSK